MPGKQPLSVGFAGQRILRHPNVSTTATYYIKTAADDVKHAMEKLENHIRQAALAVRDSTGHYNSKSKPRIERSNGDDMRLKWLGLAEREDSNPRYRC